MTTFTVRATAGLAAVATAVTLSACSSATKTEERAEASTSTSASASAASAHNSQDVMFAHMMIPHHQQALELSAMVPDRSTDPALIKLAADIAAAQKPEIDTMKRLLNDWGAGMGDMGGMDHGDMGGMDHGGMMGGDMMGMVDQATMDKLRTLKGADFDKLWLQSMIGHHEGAISMSKPEVEKGQSAELVEMARNIITSQQAEIDQMKQMLVKLGG